MLVTEKNIRFKAVRASGPGGQKVNRRSTKVQIWVKIGDLPLSEIQKKKIRSRLANHINQNDELEAINEEERSRELNKDKALLKLNELLVEALKEKPLRLPTKPPRSAENRRIEAKKIRSFKKKNRRLI